MSGWQLALRMGGLRRLGRPRILWIAVWYAMPVFDNSWSKAGGRSYHTGCCLYLRPRSTRLPAVRQPNVRRPSQPPSGGTTHYHPPAGLQPGDRRKTASRQGALSRRVLRVLPRSRDRSAAATNHITISRGGNVPLRGVAPSRWSGLIGNP